MEMDKIIHVVSDLAAHVFERPEIKLKPSDSPSNVKGREIPIATIPKTPFGTFR
jgi:hypothetical protein